MKYPFQQQLVAVHGALLRLGQDMQDPVGKRAYRYLVRKKRTPHQVVLYLTQKWGCEECARTFVADVQLLQRVGVPEEEFDVRRLVPAANVYILRDRAHSDLIKSYVVQTLDPTGMRRSSRAVTWYSSLDGTWLNLPFGDGWLSAATYLYEALKKRYGHMPGGGKLKVQFSFVPSPLQLESGESAWELAEPPDTDPPGYHKEKQ